MTRHTATHGWSTQPNLWKCLARLTSGLKWKLVRFTRDDAILVPKQHRGVYLICANAPESVLSEVSVRTILYVGSVTSPHRSLRQRFTEHLQQPKDLLARYRKCHYQTMRFVFATTHEVELIRELESLLRTAFDPPCNSIKPPGTDFLLARIDEGTPIRAPSARRLF